MAKKGTLLISEPGCKLATDLAIWLDDKKYRVITVDNIKDVFLTLQFEKIHVLVMDICIPEKMNNPELESCVRQMGIFYYHVKSFGLDDLTLAITNAMTCSSS